MKGDFTRFRFNPLQQRRRVYEQQGRVALDADANERTDIAEHLRSRGIADVVGPAGGPLSGAGFAITAAGADLAIGAGRYWVDGLLVENPAAASLLDQPHMPGSASPVVLASGNPGPATPSDGVYLIVLEAWEHLVTAAEDDDLREPALGGPDTVCATEQVWRVRAVRAGTALNCSSEVPGLTALMAQSATMAARSARSTAPPDDCSVPADAGFRGTENQHYRVEIHDGGPVGTATFKWSRENGSVVTGWVARDGNELTVSSPGRDGALGFAAGDWVELIDEGRELSGTPGTLVRLAEAEGNRLVISPGTETGTLNHADFPRSPRVRRWDSDGRPAVSVPSGNDGWIPLELGVEVRWPSSATFRTGQWWSVPARTALDDVIWPAPGGTPSQLPPFGDRHRFARLAVATFEGGTWTVESDCRKLFPPLTGLETISMLGGDGQEALPDVDDPAALVPLGQPLQVGVSKGGTPVAGASVLFSIAAGNGQVNGAGSSTPVTTDASGVASVTWALDSATPEQTVTASLLDDGGNPVHLPVRFAASLSRATRVAYNPGACADLAGVKTVSEALDRLCQLDGEGCATIVLTPGPEWYAPLVALPEGADATVCFQPGRYVVPEPVVVANKGNLVLTGAGRGSVVVAEESEVALRFVDCEQVVVRDLSVSAQRVIAEGQQPGLNGALTLEGCPYVLVESCFLACGAASRKGATCLTVRASGDRRPDSVTVRGCDVTPGHLQLGVLVLDARVSEVRGNRIGVASKPASLSFGALLADPARQKALSKQLLGRAAAAGAEEGPRLGGLTTRVRAGGYTLAFNSPVPAAEWQALADRNPPGEEDVRSKAALQRWASGLAMQALETPSGLPTFNRQVTSLRRRLGATQFDEAVGTETGRALLQSNLIAGPIEVIDPAGRGGAGGKTVSVGSGRVFFDSVLTEGEWTQLLRAGNVTGAADGRELKRAMSGLALQAVTDPALRERVPAVRRWFEALADRNPAVAWAGIVVAGGAAGHVLIEDNDLVGMREAVHVGVSAGGLRVPGSNRQADLVRVRGNRAVMRVPLELAEGPRAYFVGNGRHVTIAENDMTVEGAGRAAFREGIRVWGNLGGRLSVDGNLLAGCVIGVRVGPPPGVPAVHRWTVTGNVAPSASSAVAAPPSVIVSGNAP